MPDTGKRSVKRAWSAGWSRHGCAAGCSHCAPEAAERREWSPLHSRSADPPSRPLAGPGAEGLNRQRPSVNVERQAVTPPGSPESAEPQRRIQTSGSDDQQVRGPVRGSRSRLPAPPAMAPPEWGDVTDKSGDHSRARGKAGAP